MLDFDNSRFNSPKISEWGDGDIVIVPEPATLTLFVAGLGAMVIRKRRHN